MTPAATSMTFADFRLVKGRKQAQFVFEVPIEQADAALRMLGGLPNTEDSRWVAVARMQSPAPEPAKEPRRWGSLPGAQQAGIRIEDRQFQDWLGVTSSTEADAEIKARCGIVSKTELNIAASPGGIKWRELDREYMIATGLMVESR